MSVSTRIGSPRTAYVSRQERFLRGGGTYVASPDYGISKDPEFWTKLDGNPTILGAGSFRRHLVVGPDLALEAPSSYDEPLVPYARMAVKGTRRLRAGMLGLADAYRRGMVVGRMFGDFEDIDLLGDGQVRRWFMIRDIDVQDREQWQLQRVVEDDPLETGKQVVRYRWAVWDWNLYGPDSGGWRFPEDESWYIFHRYQSNALSLHGDDLGRALWSEDYALEILREAALDTCERHGSPWLDVEFDPSVGGYDDATGQQKSWSALAAEAGAIVEKVRRSNYLIRSNRLKMNMLEASLSGAQLIERMIADIKQEIRILLLGSNLPTSATTGGSFALAQVQDESTRRLVAYDRDLLSETLSEQYIARWCAWNRPLLATIPTGDGRTLADCAPPRVRIADEEILSTQDRSQRLSMAQSAKQRVTKAVLATLTGVENAPKDAPDEDVVDFGASNAASAQPTLGGIGFAGHSPTWQHFAEGRLE